MQMMLFDTAAQDIDRLRDRLITRFGRFEEPPTRSPIQQLIRSLISGRTRDEVSLPAYDRLAAAWPDPDDMMAQTVADIQAVIADVTFPDDKAAHLLETLKYIQARHPDFNLDFLAQGTVDEALAWLQKLPGVGTKVAASALNYSTLCMQSFIADTHVIRVMKRYGFIGKDKSACDFVMSAACDYTAAELTELHVLIKTLGQQICGALEWNCQACPVCQDCLKRLH
ncbi:MAG: endonuclease III [Asticcacaulis sp.]|uniref:endonuclease III domain-containing protein n=1 Tax=Asticcacaulis sp. TaxID=1872648 RepID=UPI0039E4FC8D